MKWIRYGPNALLIQFADRVGDEAFARGRAITAELERNPPGGLTEFVPAVTSVLLEFDPRTAPELELTLPGLLHRLERSARTGAPPAPIKEIPVIYDGPDLERVARQNQLTVDDVCQRHAAPIYKVYMLGFSPGFPYLGDLDPRLHTARLPSPRARITAGSVAIGGEHTGIYSVDSPGGWNIIGHTSVKIFDLTRGQSANEGTAMFLLRQGDRVKFVPRASS